MYGEDGDDEMYTSIYGNNELSGGKGDDLLLASVPDDSYARWFNLRRNLNENHTQADAYGNHDLLGGPGDDFILGSMGNDDIYGGEGDDIIYGSSFAAGSYGNDYIEGGPGDDFIAGVDATDGTDQVIKGGSGNDVIGAGTPMVGANPGEALGFDFSINSNLG